MWNTSTRTARRRLSSLLQKASVGESPTTVPLFQSASSVAFASSSSSFSVSQRSRIRPRGDRLAHKTIPNINSRRTYAKKARSPREALRAHALRVEEISQATLDLDPLPPLWEYDDLSTLNEQISNPMRQKIYTNVVDLMDSLQADVDSGLIAPKGRHRVEVSILFDAILRCLAESDPTDGGSIYSHCDEIMTRMEEWSIDLQHSHSNSIMLVAGREGLWKEASRLFAKRIDPRAHGHTPVDIAISNPIGLYCIARYAQEVGLAPVESVLNGVMNMSIVCPSEQSRYVLAAGSALGQAGEAESLARYVLTNKDAKQFGQHLIAATMYACLHCNRPDEALEVFDNLTGGDHQASVKWQWEGGQERLLPICRDLAMRALGVSGQIATTDECVAHMFETEDRGMALSFEAFLGILLSCEKDGEWEKAVDLLFYVVEKHLQEPWLVDGSALQIPRADNSDEIRDLISPTDLVDGLEITMRTCNSAGRFGVSLLCAQRFGLLLGVNIDSNETSTTSMGFVNVLKSLITMSHNPEDLFTTVLSTLSAAYCNRGVEDLERLLLGKLDLNSNAEYFETAKLSFDQTELWEDFLENVSVLNIVGKETDKLSDSDSVNFSDACSRTCAQASAGGDSKAALVFLDWLFPFKLRQEKSTSSFMQNIDSIFPPSDDLTAAIMDPMITDENHIEALEIYGKRTKENKDLSFWVHSSNQAIRALFQAGREDDARSLFEKLVESKCHPETFIVAAMGFFDLGQDYAVYAIYRRAKKSSCLSEHLSILALRAVCRSREISEKMKKIKQIVGNIAQLTGDPVVSGVGQRWAEKHFWHLHKDVGPGFLRWLLRWNKVDSSFLDEADLALATLKHRSSQELRPLLAPLPSVARAAAQDYEQFLPRRPDLQMVPRSQSAWASELRNIAATAEECGLWDDEEFVSDLATGLIKVGCDGDFLQLVKRSLKQGVALREHVLNEASRMASQLENTSQETTVIE